MMRIVFFVTLLGFLSCGDASPSKSSPFKRLAQHKVTSPTTGVVYQLNHTSDLQKLLKNEDPWSAPNLILKSIEELTLEELATQIFAIDFMLNSDYDLSQSRWFSCFTKNEYTELMEIRKDKLRETIKRYGEGAMNLDELLLMTGLYDSKLREYKSRHKDCRNAIKKSRKQSKY